MSKRFSLRAICPQGFRFSPLLQIATLLFVLTGLPVYAQAQGLHFGQPGEIIQTQGQQSAAYSIGTLEPDYYSLNQNVNQSASQERGFGWWARTGYDTGPGLGREESLMFFETMPYAFWGDTMFLTDLRLWRLNSGRLGGNVGVGVRHYFPGFDRTLGAIAWYDVDATYGEDFQSTTISLESRGNIDWLANIYLPFDLREQEIGLDFIEDSQNFVGNNVQFDQIRTFGFALKGFDTEVGAPIGLEFAQQFDMRAYVGLYYLNHDQLDDIWGWKARIEANVLKYLDLNLGVTDDSTFDTRVTFSASWTIDPNGEVGERRNAWDSMVLPPSRLWTIPKAELGILEADQLVINPVTGTPLSILHVNNNPALNPGVDAPGAGTVTTPFDTIDNAVNGANAPGIDTYDILYVHSGSRFDTQPTIVVPEGKRYLGGGDRVEHLISYNGLETANGLGTARLPRAIGNYSDHLTAPDTTFDSRPLFTNLGSPAGPGVTFDTLASLGGVVSSNTTTEFSGFVIGNPDGADPLSGDSDTFDPTAPGTPGQGTFGNGIEFVDLPTASTQVRFVDLHGSRGNGLHFNTTTDTFLLESLIVNQSQNHEMFVNAGAPNITLQSSTRGETASRVDSMIVNRTNVLAVLAPDGAGALGDNHDLAITATTGGSVNWIDVITNDIGGDGIIISGASQSDVSIPVSTSIVNSRGNGIAIFENTGGNIVVSANRTDFLVTSPLTITNPAFNAIQIGQVTLATETTQARVNFVEDILIDSLNQANSGLFVANASGDITFSSTAPLVIDYTTGGVGTASGIEYFQNFGGDITFNNAVTINNAGGAGIRITNNDTSPAGVTPGVFRFARSLNPLRISDANSNQGVTGAGIVIGTDPLGSLPPSNNPIVGTGYESLVEFGNPVTVINRNGMALWIGGNTGAVNFNAINGGFNAPGPDVGNTNAPSVSGVRVENNPGNVTFTQIAVTTGINPFVDYADDDDPIAAELAGTFAAVDLRNNSGSFSVTDIFLRGTSEGIFGINNSSISIAGGDIAMTDGTGLDIFTTDLLAAIPANPITQIDITLDDFNNGTTNTLDYALHLANVKGDFTILGGSIDDVVGTGADRTPDVDAGAKFDNSELRVREAAAAIGLFNSSSSLEIVLEELDFDGNSQGIYADSISSIRVRDSQYDDQNDEAIDLVDVRFFQVTGSDFSDNQATGGVDAGTIRSRMFRTLNQANVGGETFYELIVGPRNADLQDVTADDDQNTFDETNADYSILVENRAVNNEIAVAGDLSSGIIVNNSTFTSATTTAIDGFFRYADNANSFVNINLSMNEMLGDDDGVDSFNIANLPVGAISVLHNSVDTETRDNLIFNAFDNRIVLEEEGSVAFRFVTEGDGDATIFIGDTPNDALTEGGNVQNDTTLNPDIQMSNSDDAVFFFDLETDVTLSITNLEINMTEDSDGNNNPAVDQTVFLFDNVSGITDINISGNTILFDDPGATLNPFFQIQNDIQVVQFNSVSGTVTLSSNQNNPVAVATGQGLGFLTNPALLFQAPNSASFGGQLQFNNVFVP